MIRPDEMLDALERRLASRLQPARLPAADEAWQGVQWRVFTRGPRRTRRGLVLRVGVAVLVLLLLTAGLVLASPDLRAWLGVAVGMRGTQARLDSLSPAPPFTVFQPASLLPGTQLVASGYNPGPSESGAPASSAVGASAPRPSISSAARRINGQDVPPNVAEGAQTRVQQLLGAGREAVLVLIYADPAGHTTEVVERPATGRGLPSGEPATVRGQPAMLIRRDERDVLALIDQGTYLEITGSLGRESVLQFANSLQPTPLAPSEQPDAGGGSPAALPTPPAGSQVPLAQRVGTRETPRATRQDVIRQCGWRSLENGRPPQGSSEQVRCAAGLVAGLAADQGSWGFGFSRWSQAAARLGIDPSTGPADDPTVYLAQLDVTEYHGSVVVLDAASGEPYVVVALKAVPLGRALGPSEPSHVTRDALVQRCGWRPEMATQAPELFPPQTRCAARLVSGGAAEPASWSWDRARWHEAAAHFGLDPSAGPAGDPLVYVIEAGPTEQADTVVVVDAASGEPYLLARLEPAS